jgi:hypothetical protein
VPPERPWVPPPEGVCGPNVTKQVRDAAEATRTTFAKWSSSVRSDACNALTSLLSGGIAWDIAELHENGWILRYRPDCATKGIDPPCGSSIQIDDDRRRAL